MKKTWVMILYALTVVMILSSCSGVKTGSGKVTIGEEKLARTYPLDTDETLTFWTEGAVYSEYSSYKEQPLYRELMKQTGVNIDFRFPPAGQGEDAFNLMIASNDLPDIILYQWFHTAGGPQKYLDENYIIPLNDVFDSYAPNLSKYLDENPKVSKMIKTDEGKYYVFPFVRGDEWLTVYQGPAVRKDLLDKFNLSKPETMDDWYNMLTAFKNGGVPIPLTLLNNHYWLATGTNATHLYYQEDGKVKYGPMEKEWFAYIKTMQKWYSEGLIDKDYGSLDTTVLNQKMASGNAGATIGSGSNLGVWLGSGRKSNPNYEVVGVPYPVPMKGQTPKFGQKDNLYAGYGSSAITTQCKNVELAAKVLDYIYSEKGHMLVNFGIEGESYEMIDGYPKFTKAMYDENGTLSYISKYIWSHGTIQSIQDKRMYEQRLVYPEQKSAIDIWNRTDAVAHILPPITPTSDEVSLVADVNSQVDAIMQEFLFSSICSATPITEEDFNVYVEQLKELGIEDVIKVYEKAIKSYNNR